MEEIILTGKAEVISNPGIDLQANSFIKASEGIHANDDDVLFIHQWLCHSSPYVNDNNLEFKAEDLINVVSEGQFSPEAGCMVDVNHDFNVRGLVMSGNAEIRDLPDVGKVVGVSVTSMILAWRFPEIAQEIKNNHNNGTLAFSMACLAQSIRCSACGGTFEKMADACDHVKNGTGHIIPVAPKFRASSIITSPHRPADRHAKSIDLSGKNASEDALIASADLEAEDNKTEGQNMNEMETLQQEISDLKASLEEATLKVKNYEAAESEKHVAALQVELADNKVVVEQLQKDLQASESALKAAEEKALASSDEVVKLTEERDILASKVLEFEARLKDGEREKTIRENASDLQEVDKVIASWRTANGRSDVEFSAFIEALKLRVASADIPPSTLVVDEKNGVIPTVIDADVPDKIDTLFNSF